jgi:hypothetical protein
VDRAAALSRLAPLAASPKVDIAAGLCSIADYLGGGVAYLAHEGGDPVMLVVLEKIQRGHGKELVIRAALQLSRRTDATEAVLPEIERQFGADCDAVVIWTKRAGLVAKLGNAGYHEAGKIMRKQVNQ